jgi:hypothetical protein
VSTEHAAAAAAGVVQRGVERIEGDVVDDDPHATVSERERRKLREKCDEGGCRVDVLGVEGEAVHATNPIDSMARPQITPDAATLVVSDEADVALGHELFEHDVAMLRVCVRRWHQRSTGAFCRLLTGDDRRGVVQ